MDFPVTAPIRCNLPVFRTVERKADRCQRIFPKTGFLERKLLSTKWTMPILSTTPRHLNCCFKRRDAHRPFVKQDVKPTLLFHRYATIFLGRITGKTVLTAWLRFVLCRSRNLSGLAVRLVFDQALFVTYIPMAECCEHHCKAATRIAKLWPPCTSPPPRCSTDTHAWVYSQESTLARSSHGYQPGWSAPASPPLAMPKWYRRQRQL